MHTRCLVRSTSCKHRICVCLWRRGVFMHWGKQGFGFWGSLDEEASLLDACSLQSALWLSLRWLSRGIETMTLAPLHLHTATSTRPEEAPECLCVAGAQAKQEGTGDRHWGLRTPTNLRRPPCCKFAHAHVQMNIANITPGHMRVSDRIKTRAVWVAKVHVSVPLRVNLLARLRCGNSWFCLCVLGSAAPWQPRARPADTTLSNAGLPVSCSDRKINTSSKREERKASL